MTTRHERPTARHDRSPRHGIRRQARTLIALLSLLIAACTGGGSDDASATPSASVAPPSPPATTPTPAATPSPGTAPSPSAAPTAPSPAASSPSATGDGRQAAGDTQTCVLSPRQQDLPDITLTHPAGWEVTDADVGPCRFFDPGDPQIEPGTDSTGADVIAYVDAVNFARAAEPGPSLKETSRLPTTVDGMQAVRVQGTTTGDGLGPAGVERTNWIVDLDLGQDETGGVLVISTGERGTDDYARAVQVADSIGRSAIVGDDVADAGTTVARAEGGGRPYVVVYRNGCLRLFAGAEQGPSLDEACDLTPGRLAPVVLEGGDLRIVAGVTSPQAEVARVEPGTGSGAAAVAAVPLEHANGRAFAVPLPPGGTTVVTETFDGTQVASARLPS